MKVRTSLKIFFLLALFASQLIPGVSAGAVGGMVLPVRSSVSDAPVLPNVSDTPVLPSVSDTPVLPNLSDAPALSKFINAVENGNAEVVRGVNVPGVMTYRVVQQASDNVAYVSPVDGVVTQFRMAAQYGTIGLIAHNFLAGNNFSDLQLGQLVRIIYGNGYISSYVINSIHSYQALDPYSASSNFVDLASGVTYSAQQIFEMYYQGGDQVTFQTCILQDGNASWGRLFITAVPGASLPTIAMGRNVSHALTHRR